jgi:hypothetical protein
MSDLNHGIETPDGTAICALPSSRTVEGFLRDSTASGDVDLRCLNRGSIAYLETDHACYRVVVVDGARQLVLIQGGVRFPSETPARIIGATCGGSLVKVGWVAVGMRVELVVGGRAIVTSTVRAIRVDDEREPLG